MAGATTLTTDVTTVAEIRGQATFKGVAFKDDDKKLGIEVKLFFSLEDIDPEALFELVRAGFAQVVMSSRQLGLPLDITSARPRRAKAAE